MRRNVAALPALAAAWLFAGCDPAHAAKQSSTPVTSSIKRLQMSPQELRIRVRALIRPTLGIVEQAGDRILFATSDPVVRRGALIWKIETTTTFLSALLRNDPILALADAWGYTLQVKALIGRADMTSKYGAFAPKASEAMAEIETELRSFAGSLQEGLTADVYEAEVREWADQHPIEGALYRRPSMDGAVASLLAKSSGGGAFAALGSLEETTADVMTRMDLYTMYLPRLARWEGELAIDDLAGSVDPKALAAELERFTRAADRIAAVAESTPDLVARERAAALEAVRLERLAATKDLQGERKAVLEALQQERIATLSEIEAIARRLVERSSGPLHEAARRDMEDLLRSVETMRKGLIVDAGTTLNDVVDHAFWKGVELLLIAAALGGLGLVLYTRLLRR